jgi:uncharacterized Ntn-hydrolase superfamily protein
MNPYLAIDGLRRLADGGNTPDVLSDLIEADPGRELRQLGMIDTAGRVDAWTGSLTPQWSGHRSGDNVMTQGNRLVGPETLDATLNAFADNADKPLAERILCALEAGEHTGADTLGALSGTITVVDTEEYPLWDLRVDHADDPAAALRRLFQLTSEQLIPQVEQLPTRADPMGAATRRALEEASSVNPDRGGGSEH